MYSRTKKIVWKSFRLDTDTYAVLEEKTKRFKSRSECLRYLITADVPGRNKDILKELNNLRWEINKIGVNINQIVKHYNSSFYSQADKRAMMNNLIKINKLQDDLVKKMNKL